MRLDEVGAIQKCATFLDFENTKQHEYSLLKIGLDTAENEPSEVLLKKGGSKWQAHWGVLHRWLHGWLHRLVIGIWFLTTLHSYRQVPPLEA